MQSEEFKSTAAEWKAKHDTMEVDAQKERSRREAFERKVADLEKLNDQLQPESRKVRKLLQRVTVYDDQYFLPFPFPLSFLSPTILPAFSYMHCLPFHCSFSQPVQSPV